MDTGKQQTSVLRWRGVFERVSTRIRVVCAAILALACVAPIFTQWGFVGFALPGGSVSYLIFLLIPVALASLLLGTLAGAVAGLWTGLTLYVHAVAMPLDYYELTYVTPITSMCALAAGGLVLGLLLAAVLRTWPVGWRRTAGTLLASVGSSCAFTALFSVGTQVAIHAESAIFQICGNAAIMAIPLLVALVLCNRYLRTVQDLELRVAFSFWLFALVMTAFMVVVIAAYGAVTVREYESATERMRSDVTYLVARVEQAAEFNGKIMGSLLNDANKTTDEVEELMDGGELKRLLAGYDEMQDGLVVATSRTLVLGTNSEAFDDAESLGDLFDEDVLAAVERSIRENAPQRVIFLAPVAQNDLVDIALPGSEVRAEDLSYNSQVCYLMAAEKDGYRAVMILSASLVFNERDVVMEWVLVSSFVLFVVALLNAYTVLDRMVAWRIDATNSTLARIVEGDLSERVHIQGTREFVSLAHGINETVDALEGWIGEAERRMEAELATAKAIQEGALPSMEEPVPGDGTVDLYATMRTAREVGGDFYDFFELPDGRLCVVIADVSDKGVPAALFMMRAKLRIHDSVYAGTSLAEAVSEANEALCKGNPAMMFVTAFVAVLDLAAGELEFVNAGHNPPLLRRRGRWLWLRSDSQLVLSSIGGISYRSSTVRFEPHDMLLLYTDGVNEEANEAGELYGNGRFMSFVRTLGDASSREVVDALMDELGHWRGSAEQADDITLLALRTV